MEDDGVFRILIVDRVEVIRLMINVRMGIEGKERINERLKIIC